ncbi:hypothetical protein GOP47_0003328 [Adiantum capillus-veneris]|uniref:Uncharacterized protein n=1 Tax=Adiantum capillus-veneris TaxID=13818 RepID=A0A9D4VCL6_ADICA|nr:hypothetical protein GOP47_0003328 [Adiantum capillus-veneris]
MHEESNEAMDQSSLDKFEDVGKAMVEAVQKEASQGVGQPSLLLQDDRVSKVGAMLLIDILLKVALQAVLHRLQSSLDVDYVIESSLAGKSIMMYGADASEVGEQTHFVYLEGLWIQVVQGL